MSYATKVGVAAAVAVDAVGLVAQHAVLGAKQGLAGTKSAVADFLASFETELAARRAARQVAQHPVKSEIARIARVSE